MKHLKPALLAMATALAIAPAAWAGSITDIWSFNSTTSDATKYIDGAGTFTVDSATNAITGITGTITDTIDGLTVPVNGLISEPGDTFSFLGGTYTYNDQIVGGTVGSSADNAGVYFGIDGQGDSILLTSDVVHIFFPASGTFSGGEDTRSITAESIAPVPEPGPLVLLGTGILGLAILLRFRKLSRPVQVLSA